MESVHFGNEPKTKDAKQAAPIPTRSQLYGGASPPEKEVRQVPDVVTPSPPPVYQFSDQKRLQLARARFLVPHSDPGDVNSDFDQDATQEDRERKTHTPDEIGLLDCLAPLLTWMFWIGLGDYCDRKLGAPGAVRASNRSQHLEGTTTATTTTGRLRGPKEPKVKGIHFKGPLAKWVKVNELKVKNIHNIELDVKELEDTVTHVREQEDIELGTTGTKGKRPQIEEHNVEDLEIRDSHQEDRTRKVRRGRRWWGKVSPWALAALIIFHFLSYLSCFKHILSPGYHWRLTLSVTLLYVLFVLYVLLCSFTLRKHFPKLLRAMTAFEARFPMHVKYEQLKRFAWYGAVGYATLGSAFPMTVGFMCYCHPEWRFMLPPFEDPENKAFIVFSVLESVVCYLELNIFMACASVFVFFSHVIRVELRGVTRDLCCILNSSGEVETEGPLLSDQTESCLQYIVCVTAARTQRENVLLTDYCDPGVGGPGDGVTNSNEDNEVNRGSCGLISVGNEKNGVARKQDQEEAFDSVRQRYESLIDLLRGTEKSLSHFAPLAYVNGVPALCLMISAVASGDLNSSEMALVVFFALQSLAMIVFFTSVGTVVHEAALSSLSSIYAADWSVMPTSLMVKLQLFSTRLSSGNMGYSVYGFFTITRETFLMMGGTLITYAILVVQFETAPPVVTSQGNVTGSIL